MSNNKEIVADFIASLGPAMRSQATQVRDRPYALLAPDAVLTVNGTTPLSGRFPGMRLIREIFVDTVATLLREVRVAAEKLIGTGEDVAALVRISAITRSGATFNECGELCGCVFAVRDGRIVAITLYPDTSLIELQVSGRRFVADRQEQSSVVASI